MKTYMVAVFVIGIIVSLPFGEAEGLVLFESSLSNGTGGWPVSVAVGDFDGDGDQDLAVASPPSDNVSILLNTKENCRDDDGDGYADETCGGDDCDDTDETIQLVPRSFVTEWTITLKVSHRLWRWTPKGSAVPALQGGEELGARMLDPTAPKTVTMWRIRYHG